MVKQAPANATYQSKTIQNQIIDVLGEYMINNIVTEIKKMQFFSVLADEATDISNKEQMALVFRYMNEFNVLGGRVMKFIIRISFLSSVCFRFLMFGAKENIIGTAFSTSSLRGAVPISSAYNESFQFNVTMLRGRLSELSRNDNTYRKLCYEERFVKNKKDAVKDMLKEIRKVFRMK